MVVGFPTRRVDLFFDNVDASAGTHPPSYSVSVARLFRLEVKRLRPEGDQLSPSTAEIRNKWSYTRMLSICLHGVDGDIFTFT
jgi:hypothetical protein